LRQSIETEPKLFFYAEPRGRIYLRNEVDGENKQTEDELELGLSTIYF